MNLTLDEWRLRARYWQGKTTEAEAKLARIRKRVDGMRAVLVAIMDDIDAKGSDEPALP